MFWTQTDAYKLTERGKLFEAVSQCLALAEVDVLHFRLLLVLVCSLRTHTHTRACTLIDAGPSICIILIIGEFIGLSIF